MSHIFRPSTSIPGQVIQDGDVYIYDDSRSKTISIFRQTLVFGRKLNVDSGFLEFADSGSNGAPMAQDGVITKIAAMASDGEVNKTFEIRVNGTSVHTFSFPGVLDFNDVATDIDFNQGDEIEVFAVAAGTPVKNPKVVLETAWRL